MHKSAADIMQYNHREPGTTELQTKNRPDKQDVSGLTGFCSMQNLHTSAMGGGSVENVGTQSTTTSM